MHEAYAAAANASCIDEGPWACTEQGCPAESVACDLLAGQGACTATFGNIWNAPPRGIASSDRVGARCRVSCAECAAGAPVSKAGQAVALGTELRWKSCERNTSHVLAALGADGHVPPCASATLPDSLRAYLGEQRAQRWLDAWCAELGEARAWGATQEPAVRAEPTVREEPTVCAEPTDSG